MFLSQHRALWATVYIFWGSYFTEMSDKVDTSHFKASLNTYSVWFNSLVQMCKYEKQPPIQGSTDSSYHRIYPGAVALKVM